VETLHLRLGDERLGLGGLDASSNHRLFRGGDASIRELIGQWTNLKFGDRWVVNIGRTSASRRAASLSQSSRRHHPAAHPAIKAP
jgi:hypothetical protein